MATKRSGKFNLLIIMSDIDRRTNLKRAAYFNQSDADPIFNKIFTCTTLQEGLAGIDSHVMRFDVVIFSDDFHQEQIKQFIRRAKSLVKEKMGYISVVKPRNRELTKITETLVAGVDGFLCEPYSVDTLKEITKLAEKIRRFNQEQRVLGAAQAMILVMLDEIDKLAERSKIAPPTDKGFSAKVHASARMLRTLSKDSRSQYMELLFKICAKRQPPLLGSGYRGASRRVKQLVDQHAKIE